MKRGEGKYLAAEVGVAREVDVDISIEVGDASREVVVGETPATKHKRGEEERRGSGEERERRDEREEKRNIQVDDVSGGDVLRDLSREAVAFQVDLFDVGEVGEIGGLADQSVALEVPKKM